MHTEFRTNCVFFVLGVILIEGTPLRTQMQSQLGVQCDFQTKQVRALAETST